ncbi:hypothetical protein FPQ18DRAFT_320377 [Pyronema domesticum]|nr:hypothetical protein FPQ18DRAFT_320377 [Pyronema domesticum]
MRGPTRSATMAWRLHRSSETIRSGLSAYFGSSLPTTNFQPRSGTAVRWYGSSRAEDEDEDLLSLHRKKYFIPTPGKKPVVQQKCLQLVVSSPSISKNDILSLFPLSRQSRKFGRGHPFEPFQIVPYRDVNRLDHTSTYLLYFPTVEAANSYMAKTYSLFSMPEANPAHFPPPPGKPSLRYFNPKKFPLEYYYDRIIPNSTVLLSIAASGARGDTIPRTRQVRSILDDLEIQLDGYEPLERVLDVVHRGGHKVVLKMGNRHLVGLGIEGRWLVRCTNEAEARRLQRSVHGTNIGSEGGRWKAEVID